MESTEKLFDTVKTKDYLQAKEALRGCIEDILQRNIAVKTQNLRDQMQVTADAE